MLMLIWCILTEKTYLKQAKIKVVMFEVIEMFLQGEKNQNLLFRYSFLEVCMMFGAN